MNQPQVQPHDRLYQIMRNFVGLIGAKGLSVAAEEEKGIAGALADDLTHVARDSLQVLQMLGLFGEPLFYLKEQFKLMPPTPAELEIVIQGMLRNGEIMFSREAGRSLIGRDGRRRNCYTIMPAR